MIGSASNILMTNRYQKSIAVKLDGSTLTTRSIWTKDDCFQDEGVLDAKFG